MRGSSILGASMLSGDMQYTTNACKRHAASRLSCPAQAYYSSKDVFSQQARLLPGQRDAMQAGGIQDRYLETGCSKCQLQTAVSLVMTLRYRQRAQLSFISCPAILMACSAWLQQHHFSHDPTWTSRPESRYANIAMQAGTCCPDAASKPRLMLTNIEMQAVGNTRVHHKTN